jgi:hypothetical protein
MLVLLVAFAHRVNAYRELRNWRCLGICVKDIRLYRAYRYIQSCVFTKRCILAPYKNPVARPETYAVDCQTLKGKYTPIRNGLCETFEAWIFYSNRERCLR